MAEKIYTVRFKHPETTVQPVRAARDEVVDGYLVLTLDDGTVAAFFAIECVDGWSSEPISN